MTAGQIELADRLCRALRLMPCACCFEWKAGKHIKVKECVRCRAIREWEEARGSSDGE